MSNPNILVVFYSRTGNTKKVAQAIKEKIGAQIQEITVFRNKKSILWCLRSSLKKKAILNPINLDLNSYSMLIIGGPTWGSKVSSPVYTFLNSFKGKLSNDVAFFCTKAGSNSEPLFQEMESLLDKKPVATLDIISKDVKGPILEQKISEFIKRLGIQSA